MASWKGWLAIGVLACMVATGSCGQGASKDAKAKEPAKPTKKIKVTVPEIEIITQDPDGGKSASSVKVVRPNKLASAVNVAENQKLVVKFPVKNEADNELVKPDQAFVRLTHSKLDREVVLVAEADAAGHKVELDLSKRAGDFNRLSGTYQLHVDVGDARFSNAISAHVGSVKLNFPGGIEELSDPLARFVAKPEIKHMFREPEKRPPATVSTAFSFAAIAPFVLLWLLWIRLGINFRNLDFHPSSIVFYGSLGGIFYLYYMFWISLNMFTTLKYLSVLGLIAFFSGNAMFARMNRKRTGREIKE
ncbi:dolichyl-diphosphooligosaccharide--protein glycosyltransferase subunit 2-like [Paramacrobiotus metropolitanus]|uniref:dolichyl-diphosphooligosaccharide--protein glycosyltransferase subunit 2-like n=1 Tax=Paramacrobiotus metropolitanus TaxID=2943436 RepID=UPI00244604EB|nr:dolichyl-diphosphooligosaccharide--protein glycosyltransferase subunit 2-like [Paramacrobiotus metropolitanus]